MPAWRVVDCSATSGDLGSRRGQLLIREEADGRETPLPVHDTCVLLVGPQMHFSTGAMHRALDAGVTVMFTDWRGIPEGAAFNWSSHTRVGARQMAQVSASLPRRKNAWSRIVRAKVHGQAQNLADRSPKKAEVLFSLSRSVRSGDPDNVEAQAARIYWQALIGENFVRTPRVREGWNACLDYGYGILRGLGVRAVLSAGLIPSLGLFHRGRSNAFNLVDDLIEPYRPAIDAGVVNLGTDSSLEIPGVKHQLVAAATQRFESDGAGIAASLIRLAQQLGRYCEGDIDRLPVPSWNGPSEGPEDDDKDPGW